MTVQPPFDAQTHTSRKQILQVAQDPGTARSILTEATGQGKVSQGWSEW